MKTNFKFIRGAANLFAVIGVLGFVMSTFAANPKFRLVNGEGKDVCVFVVEKMEKADKVENLLFHGPAAIFGDWKWEKGSFRMGTSDAKSPTSFAYYDIDNDGEEEILNPVSGTYGSHTNIGLFIFEKNSIDFTKNPQLTTDLLQKKPAVVSDPGWPYREHGIYFIMPAPLVHEGIKYLILMDELFGRKGYPDRKLIVTKYTGIAKSSGAKKDAGRETDQLEIICKIEPLQSILPWNE